VRPFVRTRHKWNGNIKSYFTKIRCEGVNWSHLAQDGDPAVGFYDHITEPSGTK
jgi:hypothetical protein